MDKYLVSQGRESLSVFMITGGWVEGLYITCQVVKENPLPALKEKIGDQKIILKKLLEILNYFVDDPSAKEIIDQLKELEAIYNSVEIEIIPGEIIKREVDGNLYFDQTEESVVHIDDETLDKIIEVASKIRNDFLKY